MTDSGTVGSNAAGFPTGRPRHPAAGPWRSSLLSLLLVVPVSARAAEPIITVLKNTLLGGVTGLVLGGALSLVADDDHRDAVVRWGFLIGTFGGFALGVTLAARGEEGLFHAETVGIPADACWAGADTTGAMPCHPARRAAPQFFTPTRTIGASRPDAFGLRSTSLTVVPNGR